MNRDCPGTLLARSGLSLFLILFFTVGTFAAENAEDTKRFYEKVVATQPGNGNAHFDLGNAYLSEKRYSEAMGQYVEAGKLGLARARMDSYYFNVAVCCAGLGRMNDAVVSLEKCIKINPANREAKTLLDIYRCRVSP